MTLIKNVFKILSVTALLSSANVLAGDFLVNTTFSDPDRGSGSTYNNGYAYNVDKMNVTWADNGLVSVDIYTKFVNSNFKNDANNGEIVFGDLLIGTQGQSNQYDYAFVLTDGRDETYQNNNRWGYTTSTNQGALTEISSTQTSKDYHGINSNTRYGQVLADTTVGPATQGSWSVIDYGLRAQQRNNKTDIISFSFNVNGIDAFQNASQLAFSWGMSCANDIVSGVANVTRPVAVSAPATLFLMLGALGFMANSRKKKSADFSA